MKKSTKKAAKQTKGTKAATTPKGAAKPKVERKPAADAKPKRLSALDASAEVLRKSGQAMPRSDEGLARLDVRYTFRSETGFPASSPPIPGSSGEACDPRGDVPAPSRKLADPPVDTPGGTGYLPGRAA